MREGKQILRLKFEFAMSTRAISRACNVGRETVRDSLIRFQSCGLTWAEVAQMDEAKNKGVTLRLLQVVKDSFAYPGRLAY